MADTVPTESTPNPDNQSLYRKDIDAEELKRVFNRLDTNGDSKISAMGPHLALNHLREKCSIEDRHSRIKSVDFNGDGEWRRRRRKRNREMANPRENETDGKRNR
ncbi:unnamed protein product [Lupinus luteus]|uniref:EF-hand domain-containing protein n=1 Tax=Lupinus luteus TaxID=3873 RepID=A0AAV1YBL8_LUPLU